MGWLLVPNWLTPELGVEIITLALIIVSPFFIDRLRRPNLKVDILPEDLKSQLWELAIIRQFSVGWSEKEGEPLNFTPKLEIRFGVLKVTNQTRSLRHGRFSEGPITDLKADIQMRTVGHYSDEGVFQAYPQDLGQWGPRRMMSWYWQHWSEKLVEKAADEAAWITRMKGILQAPFTLEPYLRNEKVDLLQVGDEVFLWLYYFVTSGSLPTPENIVLGPSYMQYSRGIYRLHIRLWSVELKPIHRFYEVDFRGKANITVKEVKE